ncbi:hypothetical protein MBLNU13_g09855t2 [Cladosporium sp. NU13]
MAEPDVSITDEPARHIPPPKGKKVRLACQRCRDRRIKCDGQTPSCSKCAKAGVRCIDTDTYGAGVSVPRAFVADAHARLEWLENLVRTRLPDVDLDAGPQVSSNPDGLANTQREQSLATSTAASDIIPSDGPSTKRPLDRGSKDDSHSVTKRARRMAANLGLFSLNPNAMQAQYLGSSSGSFFADLLADQNAENLSDPDTDGLEDVVQKSHSHSRYHNVRLLLASLKDVLPTREYCDSMVRKFFSFYHAEYPALHQPSISSLVNALYASAAAPDDCPLQYNGWPASITPFRYNDEIVYVARQREGIAVHIETGVAHLFFVLSIAAELQTRKRRCTVDAKRFSTQAMTSLQRSVAEVSLSSTQSMVLYVLHSFLSADGTGIWVILHVAMSFAIDIGLQRDRSEAQNIWASTAIRSSVSPAEVAGDLRLVSSLLALGGEWYPLAQRGKKSFEQLADSTLNALLSRNVGTHPQDQFPTPVDSSNMSVEDNQWLNVESMLQPYFQNDLYFPDMFSTFDVADFDTSAFLFDDTSYGNTALPE